MAAMIACFGKPYWAAMRLTDWPGSTTICRASGVATVACFWVSELGAATSGASPFTTFRRVTLPYLAPAIAAAAMLAFTVSIDDYVITSLVAGVDSQTLPMVIYAMARRGASPVINAISALITVFFGILIVVSEKVRAR